MTDVYTSTPPTEHGWFWVRINDAGSIRKECIEHGTAGWWLHDQWWTGQELVNNGISFGPRIPSAKLIAFNAARSQPDPRIEDSIATLTSYGMLTAAEKAMIEARFAERKARMK